MLFPEFLIERSTGFFAFTFYDERGDVLEPDTVRWTLTDGNGRVVNSRENVAIENPESEETIVLSGLDLQKYSDRASEGRVLSVHWTYAMGKTGKKDVHFYVKKNAGVL